MGICEASGTVERLSGVVAVRERCFFRDEGAIADYSLSG